MGGPFSSADRETTRLADIAVLVGLIAGLIWWAQTASFLEQETSAEQPASRQERLVSPQPAVAASAGLPASETARINPRWLAALGTLLLAALLFFHYLHWRRSYILQWIGGWFVLAASLMLIARPYESEQLARLAVGTFAFLNIASALLFAVTALTYKDSPDEPSNRHRYLIALPICGFIVAPLFIRPNAVTMLAYLLMAATLLVGGVAFLGLMRRARASGAGLLGTTFILLGVFNLIIIILLSDWSVDTIQNLPMLMGNSVFYLFAALGMHLLIFQDMTWELRSTNEKLVAAQDKLREMAITDALTGCRNRHFFEEVIGRELQLHTRFTIPLSILFIDLDCFKVVNDTIGHERGDQLLKFTADLLLANIRESDHVFRWGGDEFLILASCSEAEARERGRQFQTLFREAPETEDLPPGVGLSIGYVGVPFDVDDVSALVQQADEQMYKNKTARRATRGV